MTPAITDKFLADVAYGLFALTAPMSGQLAAWLAMSEQERAKYRARARFILSYADPDALQAGRRPA